MPDFTATILQFGEQGEKTGWTYVPVPIAVTEELMPGNKKSFRVKGKLDKVPFSGFALLPMGGGQFILVLNAEIRKKIRKGRGAMLHVSLSVDKTFEIKPSPAFIACLDDEPAAKTYFYTLPKSHRNYYIKWIESAKTDATKARRIVQAIEGLCKKYAFGTMIRANKDQPE